MNEVEKKIERKDFFKEGPLSLVRAFFEGSQENDTVIQKSSMDGPILRPPGAKAEGTFLELCKGSGLCAEVCPANAILLLPEKSDTSLPQFPAGKQILDVFGRLPNSKYLHGLLCHL